jgi:hypothetical protein
VHLIPVKRYLPENMTGFVLGAHSDCANPRDRREEEEKKT